MKTCARFSDDRHKLIAARSMQSYQLFKSLGLCVECRKVSPEEGVRCRACKDKRNSYQRTSEQRAKEAARSRRRYREDPRKKEAAKLSLLRIKDAVYNQLGNICNCCGEATKDFLSIDHINGGGNKHRKSLGTSSYTYYKDVLADTANRFQLLCFNCNCAKGLRGGGICPHELKFLALE